MFHKAELNCAESFLVLCLPVCVTADYGVSMSDVHELKEGKDIKLALTPRWGCFSQIKMIYIFIKAAAFVALAALYCLGTGSIAKISLLQF